MAWYKYKHYVNQYTGLDDIYDALYKPGEVPPHSGIYRCIECGQKLSLNKAASFRLGTTTSTRRSKARFSGAWLCMRGMNQQMRRNIA
jgi:hypothetical protein